MLVILGRLKRRLVGDAWTGWRGLRDRVLRAGDSTFAAECRLREGMVKEPAMTDQAEGTDYGKPGPAT